MAIEWTCRRRSLALLDWADSHHSPSPPTLAPIQRVYEGPSEISLPAAMARLLDKAAIEPGDIERIIVNRGPGSYTGIRIALAAVQGFAAASTSLQIGIGSTLDCLSMRARKLKEKIDAVGVYAQRGEVMLEWLSGTPEKWNPEDPLVSIEELVPLLRQSGSKLAGPDMEERLPVDVYCPLTPEAIDLPAAPTKWIGADELFRVEPLYVREQEFIRAPKPRFSGLADT
jgi:tRNA threonylcarbamoyl adenosine modification protein YeaZ